MSPRKPRRLTDAQRSSKYRTNNPDKQKKNMMVHELSLMKKRLEDDSFNEDYKMKQRLKKQKQRAAKKEALAPPPSSQMDPATSGILIIKLPFHSSARKKMNDSSGFGDSVPHGPSLSLDESLMDISDSFFDDSCSSVNDATPSPPLFFSTPHSNRNNSSSSSGSRQADKGKLIRKQNNKEKNIETNELKAALKESLEDNNAKQIEISQLVKESILLKKECEDMKDKIKHCDDWIRPTLKYLSSSAKTEFKNAVNMAKDELEVGTLYRLRQNTGINFNKSATVSTPEDSNLKLRVVAFAHNNSCEVPDMRAAKKGLRYYFSYKYVLWMMFKSTESSDVSYSQFCCYWPKNCVKPEIEDYGSCKCQICENVELLLSALKRNNFVSNEHDLDMIVHNARDGGNELETEFLKDLDNLKTEDKSSNNVSFLQWDKVSKSGNTGTQRDVVDRVQKTLSCKDAAEKMELLYMKLKEHLHRNFTIKKTMRELREKVMESTDKALIHVDWAENLQVEIPSEVQSAYFSHLSISLHTGYLYSASDSGGFVSISDENNHRAEAVHAAINPTVEKLVRQGIKHLIIVSDSPTSQYRNKTNVWLTKELSVKHNINIDWLFTESGHGKSSCDGIGGTVKNLIRDLTAFNTSQVISNAKDVIDVLTGKTTVELNYHSKDEIEQVSSSVLYLGTLTGAMKMHQISFDSSGSIKSKGLPTDPVSTDVKLKIVRSKPIN